MSAGPDTNAEVPEEHVDLMLRSAETMLAFARHWARKRPEESLDLIIERRTEVPLLVPVGDKGSARFRRAGDVGWLGLMRGVAEDDRSCAEDDAFVSAAMKRIAPCMRVHAPCHLEQERPDNPWTAESLEFNREPPPLNDTWFPEWSRFDLPTRDLSRWCSFHIRNAVAPRSPFDDPAYFPRCFLKMMDVAEAECGFDTLFTGTWLNDYPRWVDLFPDEWRRNMGGRIDEVWGNTGYWGQLVRAEGTFNERTGRFIRERGELRYKPRWSCCSFEAMRRQIRERRGRG